MKTINDGSKSQTKSGVVWIIVDSQGNRLIKGSNPDFGSINQMNSRWSEILGVLSALLLLNEYFSYFMLSFSSNIIYFCDKMEVVSKLKQIQEDSKHFDEFVKHSYHNTFTCLKITS